VKSTTTRAPRAKKSGRAPGVESASASDDVVIEQRAKGKLGEVLAKAQGESVSRAAAADHKPFDFEVFVDGELAGIYKGNSAENLEQAIKFFMSEAGISGEVRVTPPVVPANEVTVEAPQSEAPQSEAPESEAPPSEAPPSEAQGEPAPEVHESTGA
jgi:hypothetical protein